MCGTAAKLEDKAVRGFGTLTSCKATICPNACLSSTLLEVHGRRQHFDDKQMMLPGHVICKFRIQIPHCDKRPTLKAQCSVATYQVDYAACKVNPDRD